MRVLITGAGGQLGRDLQNALAAHELRPLAHGDLDVTDATATKDAIAPFHPDAVIHAAALTDTTRCEREPDVARSVNAGGAHNVAEACAESDAAMLYVSTNEVFDGEKGAPYNEDDATNAINAYGRSKLEGERLVREALPKHYIVRTAWLYGHGEANFITKMLAAAAESGSLVGVTDEIATPTWTRDLAQAIASLIDTNVYGTYHLTNTGQASRYDWVKEILRLAGKPQTEVRPVTTEGFRASLPPNAVAPRKPPFSVLANRAGTKLGVTLRPWQDALAEYLATQ